MATAPEKFALIADITKKEPGWVQADGTVGDRPHLFEGRAAVDRAMVSHPMSMVIFEHEAEFIAAGAT